MAERKEDRPPLPSSLRMLRTIFRDIADASHRRRAEQLLDEEVSARRLAEDELQDKEAQLRAARRIQEHLLPRLAPTVPGYDIAGVSHSSEFAAGDYFDYVPMLDGGWAIAVGDVSGHRYASALMMASARAYVRSLAQTHSDVAEILTLANAVLLEDLEDDQFVTLFLGHLDPTTGSFTYASAGHEPCYLLAPCGTVRARLESTGFPLAVVGTAEYLPAGPYRLEPGEILLLVTDGVHDVRSPAGEPFGIDRMLSVVEHHAQSSAGEIVDHLRDSVFSFIGDHKPDDDLTMVVVKRTKDEG